MDRSIRRWMVLRFSTALVVLSWVGRVHAEPSPDDRALATVLFQEGRTLMSTGNISEACPKLEESERLDPGGGTILNVALCHELEGRLARSWSEFNEAIVRARKDGRRDRELEAMDHARALQPRLSRLVVAVPAGARIQGLQIECDGRELGPGAWSTAMPIDGGEHVIRATAPGRAPFTTSVVINQERDAKTIEIPVLATPVVVVTPPTFSVAATTTPLVPAETSSPRSRRRLRWIAIGTAGVGVTVLGIAGYELGSALSKKSSSNADCIGDICGDTGLRLRKDAVSRGNLATILAVTGVALVGGGATLFFLGGPPSTPPQSSRVPTRFMLGAAPGALVTAIEGGF